MFQTSTISYGGPNGACYTKAQALLMGHGISDPKHQVLQTAKDYAARLAANRKLTNKMHLKNIFQTQILR
jgi:hypothetical protein